MNKIIENFKTVYQGLDANNIDLVKTIYSKEVLFIDPFHEVNGLPALVEYFSKLYRNLDSCSFEFLKIYSNSSSAMLTWDMKFSHQAFKHRIIEVPGSTEIRFDGKINFHRDYFDAGKMIYENIPVLGSAIRYIKRQV